MILEGGRGQAFLELLNRAHHGIAEVAEQSRKELQNHDLQCIWLPLTT